MRFQRIVMRFVICAAVSVTVLTTMGCTHRLEIKSPGVPRSRGIQSLLKPVSIGVVPHSDDQASGQLVQAVGRELSRQTEFVMPYSPNSGRKIDVVAQIDVTSQYKGSGWNFLINWPGFLIFAPAWHGYIYKVNYDVDVALSDGHTNQKIDSFRLPVHLNVRHAAINRTWTECSWLEVGAIAFFGGLFFTGYDDSVTPMVMEKIQTPASNYIAQEIVIRINNFIKANLGDGLSGKAYSGASSG